MKSVKHAKVDDKTAYVFGSVNNQDKYTFYDLDRS